MIHLSTLLKYYKREDIQNAILDNARDREVAVLYKDKKFGKRPDTIQYPRDILELAKGGATSFHVSEEIWSNPLQLGTDMSRKEMDELRTGWDLVLDIDCAYWDMSKITTVLLIKTLQKSGIKSLTAKFSGNKGFHIAVSFEAFPDEVMGKHIKDCFPEGPRRIAGYLKEKIRKQLSKKILEFYGMDKLIEMSGKGFGELVKNNEFDPYALLEIDTVLISPRHLYRSVYSLHEKSGLASIPVALDKILEFEKEQAKPEKVTVSKIKFRDNTNAKPGVASRLIVVAFDFTPEIEEVQMRSQKHYEIPEDAIPEQFFPPCITLGLKGLKDGRKRFLFSLVNFLANAGWSHDKIDEAVHEWNKRNPQPLREVNVKSHLRYHKQRQQKILPPNCDNLVYYKDIAICHPDNLCSRVKNPVNYARRKTRYLNKEPKKKTKSSSQQQKA